ncbi:MAG: hypothetical protein E3J72_17100 [Planctomycetota bacterium]|nr:MAG: hypothetical protein E3J72_17100 [Planctomycetota bacterium]
MRKYLAFILLTALCSTGCSSAGLDNGDGARSKRITIPKPRKEPGYKIVLLSSLIENPMFHPYATMAINSDRFSQLDNDFGRMKKGGGKEKEGNPAKEDSPGKKEKQPEDVSLRDAVVEEYARFFWWYKNKLRLLVASGRAADARTELPKCEIKYGKSKDKLNATVIFTSLKDTITMLSEKTGRGFVISSKVDEYSVIFYYDVENASLNEAALELAREYELIAGKGIEISVDDYSFSVRPGPFLLFSSVELKNSISVDNVRLYMDLEDKSIFVLVTYPGGGETSVYFVYRFPPGKILGLPESMSVFATRRKISVKKTE